MSRFPLQQTSGRHAASGARPRWRPHPSLVVLGISTACFLLQWGALALFQHPFGLPPWAMAVTSLACGCGYAAAGMAFRKVGLSPRLRRVQDVAGFLAFAALGPLLAFAPTYLLLRALGVMGAMQGYQAVEAIRVLFLGAFLGALTLGPALLLWGRPLLIMGLPADWPSKRAWPPGFRPRHLLLQIATLVLVAMVVVRFSEPGTLHLKYLLFLPTLWVVLQGGLRAASLAFPVLALTLAALIFRSDLPPNAHLGIQSFLGILFGTALFLGAAMDSQREAIRVRDRRSLHLNHLMDATGAIPWEMDLESGRCTYLGHAAGPLLGWAPEVWQRQPFWAEVIHPDDQLPFLKFLLQVSRTRGVHQIEFKLRDSQEGEHWVRAAAGMDPVKGKGLVMGFLFDIHAHKHAEENALRVMLKEKDILLREIHHRVKNNLQVVSSLLRLQSSTSEDPALQRALKEAQERVQAIALIHQKLKHAPDFSNLDLPGYVRTLAERLVRSYASVPALIDLHVEVAAVDIGPDAPVPLGLILNELVANALQHAFPPGEGGSLAINIDQDARGWIRLRVADSGQGLPESVHLAQGGLGFQLVQALTDQLGGTLELERRRGASFLLTFPPTRRP